MNYFECVAASHGGGSSNTITVTCDSGFAGVTLTCTDGNDTYTKVCPSVSPYTVDFENLAAGDWTISGTVQGTSYSKVVSISDSYATTLESGFSWATWVDLSQNYHSADYNNLAEVFADEGALHELMTIHACCDYLIEAVTDDIDVIDDFVANDTAMKWIGLRDYVCDGLTAIAGVEAKFLASQYWERYLKDHVPTMTGNTAPYGVASAYQVFDGNASTSASGTDFSWKSPYPICVKKFESDITGGTLQGSNDGINYTDIATPSANSEYYMYHRVHYASSVTAHEVQFYGRSLNVSVPIMTSNTAPFGVASASTDDGTDKAYMAFDSNNSTFWHAQSYATSGTLEYQFSEKIFPKMVVMTNRNGASAPKNFTIEGYDGTDWDILDTIENTNNNSNAILPYVLTNISKIYTKLRLNIASSLRADNLDIAELQFYGLDYSEREFEPNSGKKWLYDHGLELEAITTSGTVTKGSNYLTLSAANSEATATVDLTNYSLLRGIVGDHMSGTTQLSVGGSNPAAATLTSANAPNNNSLDISSLSQSLATGVKMTANGICDITELWVE